MASLKSLDLDRQIIKPRNRIALIGVELEGGWTILPKGLRSEDFVRDGSLDPLQRAHPEAAVRELPSPPLEEAAMEQWMRDHWPQVLDETCGMHVHLSFKSSLAYSKVVREEYPGCMVVYLKRWAEREAINKGNPIWDRLAGKSQYCQHQFFGDDQLKNTRKDHDKVRKGHRYTVVNYCWGRGLPTAETRLLPMFTDVEIGVRAMKEVVNITNRFLAATARRERKVHADLHLGGDMVRVERRIVGV